MQGARCEVLRTEQCLLGGGLPGYLFGVLGRKALVALRAVGGCDGDDASRREARCLLVGGMLLLGASLCLGHGSAESRARRRAQTTRLTAPRGVLSLQAATPEPCGVLSHAVHRVLRQGPGNPIRTCLDLPSREADLLHPPTHAIAALEDQEGARACLVELCSRSDTRHARSEN